MSFWTVLNNKYLLLESYKEIKLKLFSSSINYKESQKSKYKDDTNDDCLYQFNISWQRHRKGNNHLDSHHAYMAIPI